MSNAKLIHDYLDGELEQLRQEGLFSQLAVSQELRQEFNQQIKLHLLARNDMGTITTPLDSTNAIFSALGFTIPSRNYFGTAAGSVNSGILSKLGSFWSGSKKYFLYGLSTIVTAVLTALIILYFLDGIVAERINNAVSSLSSVNQAVPMVSSFEKPQANNDNITISKAELDRMMSSALRRALAAVIPQQDYNLAANNLPAEIPPDNGFAEGKPAEAMNYLISSNLVNPAPKMYEQIQKKYISTLSAGDNYNSVAYLSYTDDGHTRLSLGFRNFQTRSDPEVNLPGKAEPWFKNYAASLMYEFDRNHSLGAEVGQEQYGQEFNLKNGDIVYTFRQNPLLFWYGLKYKYSMPDWGIRNTLYPVASVLIGGTSVGPLGKLQVGLQFQPDKRVTFNVSGDASYLIYNVQDKLYNTTKYGITYGIGIHY